MTSSNALFKALKRDYKAPKYVWIFYDWYPRSWWKNQGSADDISCTDSEIAEFLEMAISLRRYPLVLDTASITDAGIVSASNYRNLERFNNSGESICLFID